MSTTTVTPSQYEEEVSFDITTLTDQERKELITADASSVFSGTTLDVSEPSLIPAKSYDIITEGIPILRLPLAPSKLVTTVNKHDGSLAYQSKREQRNSGNCVLTDNEGHELISTQYFFGPGRDPVLKRLDVAGGEENVIKTVSKWTSRSQKFLLHDGRSFEWGYARQKGFGDHGKKGTALILTMYGKRIAALIRNEETRTPGSRSSSAGNGGKLVLGEEVGGKDGIAEELVIATVLLMLKKEIDRRRAVQFMMISGAGS